MNDQELKIMALAILKRFIRTFVAGALGSMATLANATGDIGTFADLQTWLLSVGVAGLTGGLLALDKWLRWKPSRDEMSGLQS